MHGPGRRGAQVVCVPVSGRARIEASGKLNNDGMTPRERIWGRADTNSKRAKQTANPIVRMLLAMSCGARCKYEVNEQVDLVKMPDDHKCKKRQVHLLSASVWGATEVYSCIISLKSNLQVWTSLQRDLYEV
ncbi:hypothetical protein IEO21_07930 [Rhodonia placenta]|uniref:Uncharacterized protein n=1 Tax=Rhodonia placenta TaxID=104341 RepID=A0A8H7NXL3_9APHY|nr:hypothetical protein IEO21_07930 [Postia placenta]